MLQTISQLPWPLILGVALAVSEALSMIPAIKANGIAQAVVNALKFLVEKVAPKKE